MKNKKNLFIFLGVFLSLILLFFYLTRPNEVLFEREAWLHGTNPNKMYFPRLSMADNLINTGKLDGLTMQQVLDLLGKPNMKDVQWTKEDYFDLLYMLGPERGFISVDSEWLGISFSDHGKVKSYKLIRD